MFRIEKLVLQNFGAYYGKQEIEFPKDNGVCIVWGDNGFGKTTITNAFRYVLWDVIYGRKHAIREARSFINTEAEASGHDMLVELIITVDNVEYTITRGLSHTTNGTYKTVFNIESNGRLLGPDEASEWLKNLLPFEISRFYVFDGELLDEYEDLLEEGSLSGENLKKSIEDILGIPVLINARENLKTLVGEADKDVQKEAYKSDETKQWGISLMEATEKKTELLKSKRQLNDNLQERLDECSDIEEKLRINAKLSDLITKKNTLETSLLKIKDSLKDKQEKVRAKIDGMWTFLARSISVELIKTEHEKIKDLEDKKHQIQHFQYVSDFISNKIKSDNQHCPFCQSSYSPSNLENMLNKFKNNKIELLSEEDEKKLKEGKEQISNLATIPTPIDNFSYIKEVIDDIREDEAEISVISNELSELYSQINNFGNGENIEAEIASLPGKLKTAIKIVEEIKIGLEENKMQLELVDKTIEKCNFNIKKLSSAKGAANATAKRDFVNKLYLTFDESIAAFRDKIKNNVEKDATESFVKICHQEEFKSLKINDNFGLQIVKEDGSFVPNRSSGYEQVVAISLISALHKNAPIAGPVFLDSTFQRVDIKHKLRTLQNLSVLSDQIIILAYPKEIGDENEVRKVLADQLKKEVTIKQLTSSKSYFE